jgi:hypothetical protein
MAHFYHKVPLERLSHSSGLGMKQIEKNAQDLKRELAWLKAMLRLRSDINAGKEKDSFDVMELEPPKLKGSKSGYAKLVQEFNLGFVERFLLILSAAPHIMPELLDLFIQKNKVTNQIYTEFGGRIGQQSNGFLPTGETAMFILAGNNLSRRFELLEPFEGDSVFAREQILRLEPVESHEPQLAGLLTISQEVLDQITTGKVRKPIFSSEFPARLITTSMDWEDLVLNAHTMEQIEEIETWLKYKNKLMLDWGMARILKPGYKALFYGPPGTGKTLTAALLGKKTGMDVFRVDLSQMVSKYIGETEKNLAKVFEKAEHKNWILFFDEGDALFGKRTQTKDSNDRHANQQVSYLLQRIEDYDGLVVLASNLKSNIDDAFIRRFQSIVHFPIPNTAERLQIWTNGFSKKSKLSKEVQIQSIAGKYEISGGSIINVIQYCSLRSLKRSSTIIELSDLIKGIKKEYHKNGRSI